MYRGKVVMIAVDIVDDIGKPEKMVILSFHFDFSALRDNRTQRSEHD